MNELPRILCGRCPAYKETSYTKKEGFCEEKFVDTKGTHPICKTGLYIKALQGARLASKLFNEDPNSHKIQGVMDKLAILDKYNVEKFNV